MYLLCPHVSDVSEQQVLLLQPQHRPLLLAPLPHLVQVQVQGQVQVQVQVQVPTSLVSLLYSFLCSRPFSSDQVQVLRREEMASTACVACARWKVSGDR